MGGSRFDCLRGIDGDWAEQGRIAESLVEPDPGLCAAQCRRIVERILKQIALTHGIQLQESGDGQIAKLAEDLIDRGLVPEDFKNPLRNIRIRGNEGMHGPDPVSSKQAEVVVNQSQSFCEWYSRAYARESMIFPFFRSGSFLSRAILIFLALVGGYGFLIYMNTPRNLPPQVHVAPAPWPTPGLQPKRKAPLPFSATITALDIGSTLSHDGSLLGAVVDGAVVTYTSLAAIAHYETENPSDTKLEILLSGPTPKEQCVAPTALYKKAVFRCSWDSLQHGSYSIVAYINGAVQQRKHVTLIDQEPAGPSPPSAPFPHVEVTPPRDNQKSFLEEMRETQSDAVSRWLDRAERATDEYNSRPIKKDPPPDYSGCAEIGYNSERCQRGYINSDGNLEGPGHFTGPGFMR